MKTLVTLCSLETNIFHSAHWMNVRFDCGPKERVERMNNSFAPHFGNYLSLCFWFRHFSLGVTTAMRQRCQRCRSHTATQPATFQTVPFVLVKLNFAEKNADATAVNVQMSLRRREYAHLCPPRPPF